MSRLATAFVLGYHGCDHAIATLAVAGELELIHSERDYDWLGPGAYFWESDPVRAREWADWKISRGEYETAAVIGAVIDLGNCLDLMSRDDIELVRSAHVSFIAFQALAGLSIPRNADLPGNPNEDRVLRFLDCAVLRHLHKMIASDHVVPPFDTVRGLFSEGTPVFDGSDIRSQSHIQIAVRSMDCIKGVFWAR